MAPVGVWRVGLWQLAVSRVEGRLSGPCPPPCRVAPCAGRAEPPGASVGRGGPGAVRPRWPWGCRPVSGRGVMERQESGPTSSEPPPQLWAAPAPLRGEASWARLYRGRQCRVQVVFISLVRARESRC